jgi:hypothetical protein
MAIVGQNALLNQYVPTFFIKDLRDGQTIRYDSIRKAFVNAEGGGGSGAERLGELLDVSSSVDNPLSLQNGQGLVYNTFTNLWENKFVDYNTLLNKPVIGSGSVTSVSIVTANGISGTVANPTTTPAITLTLGAITPTSITATGAISGTNLTGTNTGDQLITLTGDVTGSGTGTFVTSLSSTGVTAGTYGNNTTIPQVTVDAKGRITGVTNIPISGLGLGTVTSVSATGTQGVTTLVTNGTTTPNITIGLGNITPTTVSAIGTVTGSNLSGTNTGDQTITLTGDASGSGTGTLPMVLNTVNLAPGVYGTDHLVPTITVNAKGLVTEITTQHVDTTVRDLVLEADTIVVAPRHQYIVTGLLEVEGYIVNNGVIAIL